MPEEKEREKKRKTKKNPKSEKRFHPLFINMVYTSLARARLRAFSSPSLRGFEDRGPQRYRRRLSAAGAWFFFFERDNQPKNREGAREREKERRVERGAPLEVIEEREERRGGVFGCCACPVRGFSLALVLKNTDERVAERGSGGA